MTFNLEARARALSDNPRAPRALLQQWRALQLAREALEAAAKECEAEANKDKIYGLLWAASIIRRIANEKPGASQYGYAADTLDGVGAPYEQDTMSHEKPGASPHPSGDSSDEAADNLGSRTAERTSQPPAPLSDADLMNRAGDLLDLHGEKMPAAAAHALAVKLLRAAEEPDVFEAFAAGEPALGLRAAVRARDWFGPLVSALDQAGEALDSDGIDPSYNGRTHARYIIRETLSAIRARARAHGGGK